MKNNLCFIINNKELYFKKTLISFNETPIFFICTNKSNKYFLVFCIDLEELRYIIVETTVTTINKLYAQTISIRNAILSSNYFWDIKTGNTITSDVETPRKPISEIDTSVLPVENAMLELFDEDISLCSLN